MKYLKSFESKSESFTELTERDRYGFVVVEGDPGFFSRNPPVIITPNEKSKIRNFMGNSNSYRAEDSYHMTLSPHLKIEKLQDEWYIVKLYTPGKHKDTATIYDYKWVVYLCDQWEGLIECLQYLGQTSLHNESVEEKHTDEETFWEINIHEVDESLLGIRGEFQDVDASNIFIQENWVDFTKDEISQVGEIIPNIRRSFTLLGKVETSDGTKMIYKLKDEWYYVKFYGKYSSKFDLDNTYYKCDQFDGLLNCLRSNSDICNRYTKTFESKSETFEEIGMNEIDISILGSLFTDENTNAFIEDNWVKFEYSEYNQIDQLVGNLGLISLRQNNRKIEIVGNHNNPDATADIAIYKLKDEWYYVKYYIDGRRGFGSISRSYYRCDQFDGLMDCLRYIKNKIDDETS